MLKSGFSLMEWNRQAASADVSRGQFSTTRPLTLLEIQQHKTWLCVRNKVYDFAQYAPYHPGGIDELERGSGDDCTSLFEEFHPWVNIDAMLKRAQVGILVDPSIKWTTSTINSVNKVGGDFHLVRLSIKEETDNHFVKTFQEFKTNHILFHIKVRAKLAANRRYLERPYTPLIGTYFDHNANKDDDSGVVSLLIKRSKRTNRPCLSPHLCDFDDSDDVKKQPQIEFEIQLRPCLALKDDWYHKAFSIGMVCAGSGITPALQILSREASREEEEKMKRLYLVWCNQDEKHVGLKKELLKVEKLLKGRLSVIHLFSRREGEGDKGLEEDDIENYDTGRFDPEFLAKHPDSLPKPPSVDDEEKVSILICGTWEFERSVRGTLFLHGFSSNALIRIPG